MVGGWTHQIIDMSDFKKYFQLGDVFKYFIRVFKKPDPNDPSSFNLKMMHGINRISIVMFLFCVAVMVFRACTR